MLMPLYLASVIFELWEYYEILLLNIAHVGLVLLFHCDLCRTTIFFDDETRPLEIIRRVRNDYRHICDDLIRI